MNRFIKNLVIIFSLLLLSCQNPLAEETVKTKKNNVTQPRTGTHIDRQTTQQPINIISPADGSRVCQKTMVRGSVSNPGLQVFILVHPMSADKFWVQPIPNMHADGRWESYCYFGEPNQGIGEPFEIIVIASQNRNLFRRGDTLPSPLQANPQIQIMSNPVTVTRDSCLHQ